MASHKNTPPAEGSGAELTKTGRLYKSQIKASSNYQGGKDIIKFYAPKGVREIIQERMDVRPAKQSEWTKDPEEYAYKSMNELLCCALAEKVGVASLDELVMDKASKDQES